MAAETHWLVEQFSDFVVELGRQKEAVRSGRWAYYADDAVAGGKSRGESGPNPAWEAFASLVRRQEAAASQHGSSGEKLYGYAKRAMIALADEVFLNMLGDWPGRDDWESYPLQKAVCGTIDLGEELFGEIDRLLANYNPGLKGLAEVYFLVLSLGFQGKYGVGGKATRRKIPPKVEDRRQRLLACFKDPRAVEFTSRVSDEPYKGIRTEEVGGEIPSASQSLVFLGLVAAMLFALVWIGGSILRRDLSGATEKLGAIDTSLPDNYEESAR